MAICLAGVTIGLVFGLLTGGRLRAIASCAIRWQLTAFGAISALVLVRAGMAGDAGLILLVTLGTLTAAAITNRHLAGLGVVAIGLMANLVPVLLDGGTPVDPRALEAVGVDPTQAPLAPSQHLATGDTSIPVLSARIPIPAVGAVASFGDLIVAVGLAAAASNITRATTRGGIPVGEILASGPLSIEGSLRSEPGSPVSVDLAPTRPAIRRTAPRGTPVIVPAGWERSDTVW